MKLLTTKILPNSHGIRQREETGKHLIQYNALMQTPNYKKTYFYQNLNYFFINGNFFLSLIFKIDYFWWVKIITDIIIVKYDLFIFRSPLCF